MKDGITLHPEHGLNPSIEVCMICGEEMGIALLGNNIKGAGAASYMHGRNM